MVARHAPMKNIKAIILLFIANSISGFAAGISMLAIPWYFTNEINQKPIFGVIYAIVTLVSLFWGLFAGTLVDKHDRQKLFLWETGTGAFVLLSIAAIGTLLGYVPLLCVAAAFGTTFWLYNIHYPALYAFAQEITPREQYSRITSWLEIQGQVTSVLAGGIGALLISGMQADTYHFLGYDWTIPFSIPKWPLQHIFLLDGCTYLVSFIIINFITYESLVDRKPQNQPIKEQLKTGINFLKKNPLIFIFGNAAYFIFVTTLVSSFILIPAFIKEDLNAGALVFGVYEMCFAFGAVLSGIFVAKAFANHSPVLGCIITCILGTAVFLTYSLTGAIIVFVIAAIFQGLANSGARIMRVTFMFSTIPNAVIGRASSVFQVINVLFRIFFSLLFSLPFFVKNISLAYFIFALCIAIAGCILAVFYKRLVNLKTNI